MNRMIEDALHKIKRELREIGSNANTKICFEVRAPSSTSPPTPPCRIFNPLRSTELLSQPYKATEAIQPQSTSTEEGYGP